MDIAKDVDVDIDLHIHTSISISIYIYIIYILFRVVNQLMTEGSLRASSILSNQKPIVVKGW